MGRNITETKEVREFGFNRPAKEDVYIKRGVITEYTGDPECNILQGGCYLPPKAGKKDRDCFLMAVTDKDHTKSKVMKLNRDYQKIKMVSFEGEPGLGHANDFTYNPNTDKVYVATGKTKTNVPGIGVLNPDTLKLEQMISLPENRGIWTCSYDRQMNLYYTTDKLQFRVFDEDWKEQYSCDNTYEQQYNGCGKMTNQSSFCYKGKFMLFSFSEEILEEQGVFLMGTFLQQIDPTTGKVEQVATYVPQDNSDEVEFGDVIGDEVYMFGGHTSLRVSKLYMDLDRIYSPKTELFGAGKLISKGDDLNDYLIPGNYYSPDTTYTKTLVNAPVKTGFTLYVLPVGKNGVIQKMIASSGKMYKRMYSGTKKEFLPWEKFDTLEGERIKRVDYAMTHTVKMENTGSCFVLLMVGTKANLYYIQSINGTDAYYKTIASPLDCVEEPKRDGMAVEFSSKEVYMVVYYLD